MIEIKKELDEPHTKLIRKTLDFFFVELKKIQQEEGLTNEEYHTIMLSAQANIVADTIFAFTNKQKEVGYDLRKLVADNLVDALKATVEKRYCLADDDKNKKILFVDFENNIH